MRLTPWIMPFAFTAAMLAAASAVSADEHEHEPLDDQALEEEYGIKAGAVKRDEQDRSSDASNDSDDADAQGGEEERAPDAGTGGSGSADVTRDESSSEKSMEEEE